MSLRHYTLVALGGSSSPGVEGIMVRRCKFNPGLKAPLVSKFDCEKGHIAVISTWNPPCFVCSLHHYVMAALGGGPILPQGPRCMSCDQQLVSQWGGGNCNTTGLEVYVGSMGPGN